MSTNLIQELPESLQLARESALVGNYETSLIYFDGVVAQVVQYVGIFLFPNKKSHFCCRHLRTINEPEMRGKWSKVKEDLISEMQLVKDIVAELNGFKVPF